MKGVYVGFYSNGHRLSGILRIPEEFKDGEKKPGIVVCHGFAAFKEMVPLPQVATAFTEAGYVTLTFDYRGFGTSEGPRWRLIPMEEVEDIRNAITFLQSRPEVDKEKLVYGEQV
jgi:Predicted hydrolase of the alpha/beta superfamily